jgi:hypothetical protein
MKPTKNRIFCPDCGRPKMLFESEKKANTFIKFNKAEIQEESNFSPERSYFCIACNGWHVTSRKEFTGKSSTELALELYHQQGGMDLKEKEKIKAIRQEILDRKKATRSLIQEFIHLFPGALRTEKLQAINTHLESIESLLTNLPSKGERDAVKIEVAVLRRRLLDPKGEGKNE